LRVGPLAVGTLLDWEPHPGKAISWELSPAAAAKALQAPVSHVPLSYMRAQHVRGYCEQKAKGLAYSRLMIVSCAHESVARYLAALKSAFERVAESGHWANVA
jgi:mycolipenoyl-CoA---2-(long-chain-fatty acyl)-trehalose mycolipenoyltransferase / long-chain-acyl-CoA---trehalose acyltransferase